MGTVVLRPGKENPILNHHPWIFSGAIGRIEGNPTNGDIVEVLTHERDFLARGYINRHSQITVRLLTWYEGEKIDRSFWLRRTQKAIHHRQKLLDSEDTTACRLIHAESDLLPGLVVDRYGQFLVVQALTQGVERHKTEIIDVLFELLKPLGIYERSDVDVRRKEKLAPTAGLLRGREPSDPVRIRENGHTFLVDIKGGQKTGFYLDQRDNRQRLASYSEGRTVLNAFAYTGSFAVYAASAGAGQITNLDTSAEALTLARRNMHENALADRNDEYIVGDVFEALREYRTAGRRFDLIILDPPKFAYSKAQVPAACRGYKDINMLSMQLLQPEGVLCTMSCSGLVSSDLFQKVVFGASVDAGRDVQVLERLSQATDHPVLLTFPEGEYLKGLICRVM
jgi:23S rRNA (cytosine1962-C5)-methyltransferase